MTPSAADRKPRALPEGPFAASPGSLSEAAVPLAVLAIVLAMIAPIPPALLDILISANITVSLVVLLVSLYITRPVEFSVFPTSLLLMTLFRLALNISSSRLILIHGSGGTGAAGEVIEAFGNFVVGGNYIIGVVIFLVLIAIQYVVINHGAVRISEVTARFTLDAMPGKQMSIDSDLNAGLIDEAEARRRRKELAAEAEFYGAMDGASRFTQRDAVASILITAINILAGFLIGVLQHGMELRKALETYTVLTIGDGLVTVIPALMISISGGLIVTRASSEARLSHDVRMQIFSQPQPLLLASGVLAALAAFPGLPSVPFLALSGGVGALGWKLRREIAGGTELAQAASASPSSREGPPVESLLRVDPLSVEVGMGLVRYVEGGPNSALLRRIAGIRRQLAAELGFIVPAVRVTDNVALRSGEYTVQFRGVEVSRFELLPNHELAIQPARATAAIAGVPTREPAFGIPAQWVPAEGAEQARAAGYTVVDGLSVFGTHLAELIRRNAHELMTRQEAKKLLDRVAEENPRAVEDLVPKLLPLAVVQRVLQNLLRERVSVKDGAGIVEALGEAAAMTRNPVLLTEFVRQSLRRMLVKPHLTATGELPAYLVDAAIEQAIESAVEYTEHGASLQLPPQKIRDIGERIARTLGGPDSSAVLLASAGARSFLRQITENQFPSVAVLSHSEVPPGVRVSSLGVIQ